MSSSFNGWSAYDIVGSLTKKEVRALLLDYDIERSCFRTWDAIEEMILASSDEVKNVVYQSALAKKKVEDLHRNEILKRKREEKKMARNVRRRLGEYYIIIENLSGYLQKKKSVVNTKETSPILWCCQMLKKNVSVTNPFMKGLQMKRLY